MAHAKELLANGRRVGDSVDGAVIASRHRKAYERLVAIVVTFIVAVILISMIVTMLAIAVGLHRR